MDLPVLRYLLDTSDIGLRFELVAIILSICYLVFWFFQKVMPHFLFGEDAQYAGYIYNAMGVVYSLVFAFVTVLVWQNYNSVNDAVAKEASSLNDMYFLFSAYNPKIEGQGREALKGYTTSLIQDEWPLLSKDQFSLKSYQELKKLGKIVINLQPQNLTESNAHQQLLRVYLDVTELRRSRIFNAGFSLSHPAWIGLISSSYIFLFFSCLFKMSSVRTHLVLILFLGLTIVGVVYFLVLYIHPFLGPMAIQPDAFVNLLKITWHN
jgi:hypothetical protein